MGQASILNCISLGRKALSYPASSFVPTKNPMAPDGGEGVMPQRGGGGGSESGLGLGSQDVTGLSGGWT